ncbi:MAG TPA: hypothetical protein VK780_01235, partial [Thermoanaerobaculia bacterium]|nr:hypothetical protein [Thermoanaerobaculia bacterium]
MRDAEAAPTVRSVIAEGARWLGREARERKVLAAALAGALLLIPLLGWILSERRAGDVAARRLTLTPSVALVGTLSPTLSDSYGAVVPGVEVKILWLVEEGTLVAPGQKLIQFDPAPFQKELDTARARAQELGGEADQGRLAVQALGLRVTGDLEEKRSAADRSERELSTLVNSTAPLNAQESGNDVEMRERFLQEAQTKLE